MSATSSIRCLLEQAQHPRRDVGTWWGVLLLFLGALTPAQSQVYYASGSAGLWSIQITGNNCTASFIGPFEDPVGGNPNVFAGDIAICPDGSMYITDNSNLWEVDPGSGQVTLAVESLTYLGVVALGCAGNGIVYGVAFPVNGLGSELYEYDVNAGTVTSLGDVGFQPGGDLVNYDGTWYLTSISGLVEVDIGDPSNSSLVQAGVQGYVGMTVFQGACNTLLAGDGNDLSLIDITTGDVTAFCTVPGVQIGGLTTPEEFTPPPECEIVIDLDNDDSSGATEADYLSPPYSCLTPEGLPICDVDPVLQSGGEEIQSLTITLVSGNANGADEFLELLTANNINIAGSGTDQLVLTNAGGATVTDFREALEAVSYLNNGVPLIPGDRIVEVFFETVSGNTSEVAEATIPVEDLPDLEVDLGEDVTICAGNVTILDAGISPATYQWSTGDTGQQIAVTDPGTYAVTVTTANECPGADTVEVIVLPVYDLVLSGDAVCPGEPAELTIATSSPDPLDLELEASPSGQAYLWSGATDGSSYTVTLDSTQSISITNWELASGMEACWQDTVLTAVVTIFPTDSLLVDLDRCDGEGVFVGGGLQTNSGTYEDLFVNQFGCDSLVITNLTFFSLDTTFLTATTCDPAQAGVSETFLVNENGCDSVLITTTSLLPTDTTYQTLEVCNPGQVGIITITLSNQFGCDSLVVVESILAEADTTFLNETTCDPQAAGSDTLVLVSQSGCDSVLIIETLLVAADTNRITVWTCDPLAGGIDTVVYVTAFCDSVVITTTNVQPSDTTFQMETTCDPLAAGQDTVFLNNQFGCDSLVITTLSYVAADTLVLASTTCDPVLADTLVTLLTNAAGCDSVVIEAITLLPSSRDTILFASCNPVDTGTTVTTWPNQFGCDSTVISITSLVPADSCALDLSYQVEPGPCAGDVGQIILTANLGVFPVSLTWTGPGGSQTTIWTDPFTPLVLNNLLPGTYAVQGEDASGQMWKATIDLAAADPLTAVLTGGTLINGYDLACAGDSTGERTVAVQGGTEPYQVQWSTGGTGTMQVGLSAGLLQVTVTDANGCVVEVEELVTEPPQLRVDWQVAQDPCDGIPASLTTISSGGVPSYAYLLDGTIINGLPWPALPEGFVIVAVEDANSCRVDTTLFIEPESVLQVDLGPDRTVPAGTAVTLQATVNPDTVSLASILWSGGWCGSCLDPQFVVEETQVVTVTVISPNGCVASAQVVLNVEEEAPMRVYIPNVFSPNRDGLNDSFAPQGDASIEVVDFAVYARWGEEVYRSGGFQLGDPGAGWDGSVREMDGHVDVYVYTMILRWPDGQERLFKGDVTLVR